MSSDLLWFVHVSTHVSPCVFATQLLGDKQNCSNPVLIHVWSVMWSVSVQTQYWSSYENQVLELSTVSDSHQPCWWESCEQATETLTNCSCYDNSTAGYSPCDPNKNDGQRRLTRLPSVISWQRSHSDHFHFNLVIKQSYDWLIDLRSGNCSLYCQVKTVQTHGHLNPAGHTLSTNTHIRTVFQMERFPRIFWSAEVLSITCGGFTSDVSDTFLEMCL